MNSRCFKLYGAYSISFSSSKVSKVFWSWVLKTVLKFGKRTRIRQFHIVVLQWRRKKYKEAWCTCQVVVKPAFLNRSEGFQIWYLAKRIFTSIERELHVSTPYELLIKHSLLTPWNFDDKKLCSGLSRWRFGGSSYLAISLDCNEHIVRLFPKISVGCVRVERVLFMSLLEQWIPLVLITLK